MIREASRRPRPRTPRTVAGALVVLLLFHGCGRFPDKNGVEPDTQMQPREPIEVVLERHNERLLAVPGVVGTAIGLCDDDRRCIKVLAAEITPEIRRDIPDSLDGYEVDVEVTGRFRPRTSA